MSKEPRDPESHADDVFRNHSERDTSRQREAAPLLGDTKIVAQWPCRGRCGALVDITEAALDVWRMFNSKLRSNGEEPIDAGACVFCLACRDRGRAMAADGRREEQTKIATMIRRLKEYPPADEEAELFRKLEGRHPALKELKQWLAENRPSQSRRGRSL